MVDHQKYLGKFFLKLADVQEGPLVRTIVNVEDGSYDKCEITFDSGDRLSLNTTNFRTLFAAFGKPEFWPGKRIELFEGELPYQGKTQPGIRVRPIDQPPAKPLRDELDDKIAF
jgi:hypothetical protein